jgi:Resolvase, N terminal domain
MIYGYARVSSEGQSLSAQLDELKAAGCQRVFQEKVSGARSDRRELTKLIAKLGKGDTLIVSRLDRLARSSRDLLNILHEIGVKGASFRSLGDPRYLNSSWAVDADRARRLGRVRTYLDTNPNGRRASTRNARGRQVWEKTKADGSPKTRGHS